MNLALFVFVHAIFTWCPASSFLLFLFLFLVLCFFFFLSSPLLSSALHSPQHTAHKPDNTPHAVHSQGLETDEKPAVLGSDSQPVAGLYASGKVAGELHGKNRLGGNSLLEFIVFDRVAGVAYAQYMLGDRVKDSKNYIWWSCMAESSFFFFFQKKRND